MTDSTEGPRTFRQAGLLRWARPWEPANLGPSALLPACMVPWQQHLVCHVCTGGGRWSGLGAEGPQRGHAGIASRGAPCEAAAWSVLSTGSPLRSPALRSESPSGSWHFLGVAAAGSQFFSPDLAGVGQAVQDC